MRRTFIALAILTISCASLLVATPSVGAAAGSFHALTPYRALDTRGGAPFGPDETRSLQLAGLPAQATAAALNVTVIAGAAPTYVTVWPGGAPRPWASNVNVDAGATTPNLVLVGLNDRTVQLRNEAGATHLIVDVVGYFDGDFTGINPARVLDTRDGTGAPAARLRAGERLDVAVTKPAGIPDGAAAVAINITATNPSADSYLTAWPAGLFQPASSNVNMARGQTVANMAVVGVSADGRISLLNGAGETDVVIDVLGWFSGAGFTSVSPARLLDTRASTCGFTLGAAEERRLTVAGAGGVPGTGVEAVALNVTAVGPSSGGYLAVYPAGVERPYVSNLNFRAGQTVPNAVLSGVGAGGQISIYNPAGTVHVLVDVTGWFGGTPIAAGPATPCPAAALPPTPVPDPIPPAPLPDRQPGVTPGAFCSPGGAYGETVTGALMLCTTSPTDTRNRWRAA